MTSRNRVLARISELLMRSEVNQELDTGEAIDLLRGAYDVIERLTECLEETHEAGILDEYSKGGARSIDDVIRIHRKEEPDCSYCEAIREAR